MRDLHETHVCRDCGAEITMPFAGLDQRTIDALEAIETAGDIRLTPESQAAVDWARKRLFCDQCPHAWTHHTVGGMCDGGGIECWCVMSPPVDIVP